jgi:hypothetical protein
MTPGYIVKGRLSASFDPLKRDMPDRVSSLLLVQTPRYSHGIGRPAEYDPRAASGPRPSGYNRREWRANDANDIELVFCAQPIQCALLFHKQLVPPVLTKHISVTAKMDSRSTHLQLHCFQVFGHGFLAHQPYFARSAMADYLSFLAQCVDATNASVDTVNACIKNLEPGVSDLPRLTKVFANEHVSRRRCPCYKYSRS